MSSGTVDARVRGGNVPSGAGTLAIPTLEAIGVSEALTLTQRSQLSPVRSEDWFRFDRSDVRKLRNSDLTEFDGRHDPGFYLFLSMSPFLGVAIQNGS